jgi:type II secretory pathway pseudopilin PulG
MPGLLSGRSVALSKLVAIGVIAIVGLVLSPTTGGAIQGTPRIHGFLAAQGDIQLAVQQAGQSEKSAVCGPGFPANVPANTQSEFCFQWPFLVNGEVTLHYEIQVPDGKGGWKDSGFYMDSQAKVPGVGANSNVCNIKQDGGTQEINWAPYVCQVSWGRDDGKGNDPQPHWTVSSKASETVDAVSDPKKANDLVSANCTVKSTPQCRWVNVSTSAFIAPEPNWTQVTSAYRNCPANGAPGSPVPITWNRGANLSWSDNINVKYKQQAQADIDVVKVTSALEVGYAHTVTDARSYNESVTYPVQPGDVGALYLEPGIIEAKGDFNIYTPDKSYIVKNVIFDFPLANTFHPPNGGQPISIAEVELVTWKCDGKQPPAPPKTSPGLHIHTN